MDQLNAATHQVFSFNAAFLPANDDRIERDASCNLLWKN